MKKDPDAIIIGAGIIGCAIALALAKRGYNTLDVDKLASAGAGSTSNSCGNIRAYYSTREGIALAYESFFYWRNWPTFLGIEDEQGYAKFKNTGSVFLKTKAVDWRSILKKFQELGVEHEEWKLDTLKKRMPMCDFHSFWPPRRPDDEKFWDPPEEELEGAIYTPGSGYVSDPLLATHNLQRAAESYGAEFLFNREVIQIHREEGKVIGVKLNDGQTIETPVIINAAGPHSFVVNRMAGVEKGMNIKTRALRHEVHHVPSPPGINFEEEGYHTNDGDTGIYFRPEVGNNILIGSVDPTCDPKEWVEDPDHFNRCVTEDQWKAQVYRLAKRIPDLPIPARPKGICDLYDVSEDWIPIYDKSDLTGYYMAIGTSGNQFKTAPVVGAMMAEMIDDCEKGRDQDKDPLQFTLHYTALGIDTAFFSRLRKINPKSSFSVVG